MCCCTTLFCSALQSNIFPLFGGRLQLYLVERSCLGREGLPGSLVRGSELPLPGLSNHLSEGNIYRARCKLPCIGFPAYDEALLAEEVRSCCVLTTLQISTSTETQNCSPCIAFLFPSLSLFFYFQINSSKVPTQVWDQTLV